MTTPDQLRRMEEGLNTISRKVLNLVPLQESWTPQQIYSEALREGKNIERQVIDAVLADLVERGLIKETPIGRYQRRLQRSIAAVVRQGTIMKAQPENVSTVVTPAPATGLARLMELSKQLEAFSRDAAALAGQIDEAILQVSQESEQLSTKLDGLRKLKTLFEGLD